MGLLEMEAAYKESWVYIANWTKRSLVYNHIYWSRFLNEYFAYLNSFMCQLKRQYILVPFKYFILNFYFPIKLTDYSMSFSCPNFVYCLLCKWQSTRIFILTGFYGDFNDSSPQTCKNMQFLNWLSLLPFLCVFYTVSNHLYLRVYASMFVSKHHSWPMFPLSCARARARTSFRPARTAFT